MGSEAIALFLKHTLSLCYSVSVRKSTTGGRTSPLIKSVQQSGDTAKTERRTNQSKEVQKKTQAPLTA